MFAAIAVESAGGFGLERMHGVAAEPYRTGDGGRMLTTARYLTISGGVAALAARRSRTAASASAALLIAGGLCAKFGVLRADASLPFTLTMLGFACGGVAMGRLQDRFGILAPALLGIGALSLGFFAASILMSAFTSGFNAPDFNTAVRPNVIAPLVSQ